MNRKGKIAMIQLSSSCVKKIGSIIQTALNKNKIRAEKDDATLIKYVDCVVTCKIIRSILKDKFPQTKFCVRSEKYSGGSGINVFFLKGDVTTQQVNEAIQWLCCKGFDGMTDSTYYTGPVSIAGYRIQPTSYISVAAYDPGSYMAKELKL